MTLCRRGSVDADPADDVRATLTRKPNRQAQLPRRRDRLYHTLDPHDPDGQYRTFAWLEPAGGNKRRYLAPLSAEAALHAPRAYSLRQADKALAFEGAAATPGRWQFVLELQPGLADEQYV